MTVRLAAIILAPLLILGAAACTSSRPTNAPSSTSSRQTHASGSGITLSLQVSQRAASSGQRFSVTVSLTGDSSTRVKLETPGGSRYRILATSAADGRVVTDSLPIDKAALAQVPASKRPSDTITLDLGETLSSTYEFTIDKPGQYTVTAATFAPKVTAPPIVLTVP